MKRPARLAFAALAISGALGPGGLGGCKNPDDGPTPFVMPAYPVRNLPPLPPNTNPDTATKGPVRWPPGPPRREPSAPTPVPEPPRPLSPAPQTPPPARPVPLEPIPRAANPAAPAP